MDFVINNWKLLLVLGLIVIDIVVAIIFKKRPQIIDNSFLYHLSLWIQEAESKFKVGKDKKDYVLEEAKKYLGEKFSLSDVSNLIEYLLSLPEKKEK